MTLAPRTRTVLIATLALWAARVVAFGLGLLFMARGPLPVWLLGWLAALPATGIPLCLLIYRQSVRWGDLDGKARWRRLAPLLLTTVLFQATIDHLLFMGFDRLFAGGGVVTPLSLLRGVAFNMVIYVWLFGLYTVVVQMILTAERIVGLRRAEAEAKAEARQAQLELLRGQLNPHFLFNTLNNLSALVVGERLAEADRAIGQLARYLRCSLDSEGADDAPLRSEIDFVRAYLDIEALRFPHPIAFQAHAPGEAQSALTPCLLLQPLIEGLVREVAAPAQGAAEIRIDARRSGEYLCMRLTGRRYDGGETPDIGRRIEAVRSRLHLLHGDQAAVDATVAEGGASIEIRLPWLPERSPRARS